MEEINKHPNFKKGMALTILGWFFFSTSNLFSRVAATMSSFETMLFFRMLIGFLLMIPFMLKNHKESFKLGCPKLVFLRGITIALNAFCVYVAVTKIPLMDVSLLQNTTPFFVPFVAFLWLRNEISHRLWLPIFVGFIGIIFILRPGATILNVGAFYALFAGISAAVALVALHQMAHKESMETVLFYTFFFAWILSTPFALFNFRIDSSYALIMITLMAILSNVGQWAILKALHFDKPAHLAPFGYFAVLFSCGFDYFLYGVIPSWMSLSGMVLVVFSGIILLIMNTRKKA
jgi:drug/metabolite transporter (DMT)-like permease